MRYSHGLAIGKFYPPHRGHHHLIRAMARQCRTATVLVEAASVESIPLADRVRWLREAHAGEAGVHVLGVRCDVPVDFGDEVIWTAQTAIMRAALAQRPPVDAVFSSEKYGEELAARLGGVHVPVDPERVAEAISATAIRADLAGHWDWLDPATRAGLAVRLVFLGAESTGTTTVSEEVARRLRARGGVFARTGWVAEYGREYTELKLRGTALAVDELVWDHADFDRVAAEQTRREEAAARAGGPILVCDTDAFATAVWERRYLGARARRGRPWAGADLPRRDVYLLTDHVGVPWQDDGLREGDIAVRAAMTGWFAAELTAAGHSWALLTGSVTDRVDLALTMAEHLWTLRSRLADPLG